MLVSLCRKQKRFAATVFLGLLVVASSSIAALEDGLQLYYPFNTAAEGAKDYSGNNRDGVLYGSPVWAAEGVADGCRMLGSGNFIDAGRSLAFESWEQFSLSFWFMRDTSIPIDTTGYGDKLFCKSRGGSDFYISMLPGGVLWLNVGVGSYITSYTKYEVGSNQNFQDGIWHHIVITKDGNNAAMWIDGVLASTTNNAFTVANSYVPLYIGYSPSPDAYQKRYWPGGIDEFRIYDRVLTAQEVALLGGKSKDLTVTLDANGGQVAESEVEVRWHGTYGELPEPERYGYNFEGWVGVTNDIEFVVDADTVVMIESDHTLTASWSANSYRVYFDPRGGQLADDMVEVLFESEYPALPVPQPPLSSRIVMGFEGWINASGEQVVAGDSVTVAEDHTLYAVWSSDERLPAVEESDEFLVGGTYSGYVYHQVDGEERGEVKGILTVKLPLKGRMSAKVVVSEGNLSFTKSAVVAESGGTREVVMQGKKGEVLILFARNNRVWGVLEGGSTGGTLLVEGVRERFKDRRDIAAQIVLERFKGSYAVSLPKVDMFGELDAAVEPQGVGYLTVKVGAGGRARVAGVLADGTRVSLSSQALLPDGCEGWICVPLFRSLYSKRGGVGGLLWLDPESGVVVTDRELGWFVNWSRGVGRGQDFELDLEACGGLHDSGVVMGDTCWFSALLSQVPYLHKEGVAYFAEAGVPDGIGVQALGQRMSIVKGKAPVMGLDGYDYSGENCAQASLSYARSTGIFKGNFNLYYDFMLRGKLQHKRVKVKYSGIYVPARGAPLNNLPIGMGHCLLPDNSVKPSDKQSMPVLLEEIVMK